MLQSPTSLPHLLSLSASLPSPLPLPPLPLAPLLLLSSPLASLLLGPTWVPLCLACLSGDSSVANAVPVCPIKALKHCFVYGDSHLVWEQTSIILPCCQALEWDGGSGPRWERARERERERERERRMMDWTRSLIAVFHFHTDLCLISALTHTDTLRWMLIGWIVFVEICVRVNTTWMKPIMLLPSSVGIIVDNMTFDFGVVGSPKNQVVSCS